MSSTCKLSTSRNLAHINTKVHVAVNDNGLPVKALITSGTVADCSKAIELIDGLEGDIVIADKGYDSTEIAEDDDILLILKIEAMAWSRMQIRQKYDFISSYALL